MRLDKYLKVSRLIKRRTIANEACDAGRVMVNGKVAKASVDVTGETSVVMTIPEPECHIDSQKLYRRFVNVTAVNGSSRYGIRKIQKKVSGTGTGVQNSPVKA